MQQRKTVFITGASRGIGHATAQYFVRQGWRAITCSREVVPPQCPRNERHAHITADLSETSRLSEAMAQLEHILNGAELHALVNNAGYSPKSEDGSRLGCLDGDMGVWQKTFAINFMAPVYFARTAAPMLAKTGGAVVNITSIAGKRASDLGGIAYCASKFGATGLGTAAGLEEAQRGIRITNIYPGEVDTPLLEQRPHPVSDERRAAMLKPADVAHMVLAVVQLPPHAHVPEMVVKPTIQAYS